MGVTRHFSSEGELRVLLTLSRAMASRSSGLGTVLWLCIALEILVIGLGAIGPYALKLVLDVLNASDASLPWAASLVVLFVVSSLAGNVIAAWRQVYSQQMIDCLNANIVDDAMKTAMPDLAGARQGDSSRIQGLVERLPYGLQILVGGLIWQVFPTSLQVLVSLCVIAGVLTPIYVAVLAVTLVSFAASTWYGAKQQQAVSTRASLASSLLSEAVGDILRNARRVVLNGALPAERRLIRERFTDRANAFRQMLMSQVGVGALQYGVAGTGLCWLMTLGVRDVLAGTMTLGGFVLLQAYAFRLVLPLSGFGFVISQAALALITVRDILELGREEEGSTQPPVSAPAHAATLELRDVSFSYGAGLAGLRGVNVTLPAGSFTVIVGANGSGKSTLAQLMAGILEPSEGTVHVGDLTLATIQPDQRHRYLIYVPQTVTLLNRSLRDNAIYPPTGLTEPELARLLTTWRFYDPPRPIDFAAGVGELGERLSGGQRQKLELARLAGVRVPVIILDESTSALDPVSEAEIIGTLKDNYGAGTTLVLITHRRSLAEMADQVLFMTNGTLMRAGTHVDLMTDSAAYARLWHGGRD